MITLLNLDVVARSMGRVFRMPEMCYLYDSQQRESHNRQLSDNTTGLGYPI